jgi:hypothetical protein
MQTRADGDTEAVFVKEDYYDRIGYHPHRGQEMMHSTPSRFKVIPCGRRWGKTLFGAREAEPNAFVECRITGEPQKGWIIGPHYVHAEKEFGFVYDSLRKQGIDKESIKFVKNVDSGNMHIITNWGFELIGKSAAHPETLVGDGLNFIEMVEAGLHKRKTWQYVRPALSDRRGWAIFTGVPEGKSEESMLYALFQRGQSTREMDRLYRSWTMPSWTNTVVFPGGRRDMEILDAEGDLTADEFARQYGAEFRDKVGAVMQEWEDEFHLGDFNYEPSWPLYMAVDYGFTNPFVVLWIQVSPVTGQIRVISERRFTQMDTPEVATDLLQTQGGFCRAAKMLYPDPAEPDDTKTMMNSLRIPVNNKCGGELKVRLAFIRRSLKYRVPQAGGVPQLQIDRTNCKELAWEMREGYRWPEHRSEVHSQSENPMDKDNHGVEALGRFFKGYFRTLTGMGGQSKSTVTNAKWG